MTAGFQENPEHRARDGQAESGDTGTEGLRAGRLAVPIDRRGLLTQTAVLAAGLTALGAQPAKAAKTPEKSPPAAGDRFMIIKGQHKGSLLRPELLEAGAPPLEGFPYDPLAELLKRKSRLNRVLALRLDPAEMDQATRTRSVEGVLVYSALCTHRSCTIKSWKAEERHLRCHCHLSEFAALSEGSVMSGPARRQLPMVPLGLDDEGYIVAIDGFTRKPGGAKK